MTGKRLFEHLYFNKLPEIYRTKDRELKTFPLKRYLQALIEFGDGEALKDINGVRDLVNPEKCDEKYLRFFLESFGLPYFEDIPPLYYRRFLSNIGGIVKRRGTYASVHYFIKVLTGMQTKVEYLRGNYNGVEGRHLIITLLAETLDQVNNMEVSANLIRRFIEYQIPYYIYPHINSEVKNIQFLSEVYTGIAIVSNKRYNLSGR